MSAIKGFDQHTIICGHNLRLSWRRRATHRSLLQYCPIPDRLCLRGAAPSRRSVSAVSVYATYATQNEEEELSDLF